MHHVQQNLLQHRLEDTKHLYILKIKTNLRITTSNQTNNAASPSRKASAASTNVTTVISNELNQLIEEKLKTIENKITSVEKHLEDQLQELLNLIKETGK